MLNQSWLVGRPGGRRWGWCMSMYMGGGQRGLSTSDKTASGAVLEGEALGLFNFIVYLKSSGQPLKGFKEEMT